MRSYPWSSDQIFKQYPNLLQEDLALLMEHLPSDKEPGILPTEIKKLVDSRREVKKLMAVPNVNVDLKHQVNDAQISYLFICAVVNPNFLYLSLNIAVQYSTNGAEIDCK